MSFHQTKNSTLSRPNRKITPRQSKKLFHPAGPMILLLPKTQHANGHCDWLSTVMREVRGILSWKQLQVIQVCVCVCVPSLGSKGKFSQRIKKNGSEKKWRNISSGLEDGCQHSNRDKGLKCRCWLVSRSRLRAAAGRERPSSANQKIRNGFLCCFAATTVCVTKRHAFSTSSPFVVKQKRNKTPKQLYAPEELRTDLMWLNVDTRLRNTEREEGLF